MQNTAPAGSVVLSSQGCSLALSWAGGVPVVDHWGRSLDGVDRRLLDRPVPNGGLDADPPLGLIVEEASGVAARPGVLGYRSGGTAWSPRFTLTTDPVCTDTTAVFELADPVAGLELTLGVSFGGGGELVVSAELRNTGTDDYTLLRLAPSLPVPVRAAEVVSFDERWCLEYQMDRSPFTGLRLVENRRVRTSGTHLPAVIAGTAGFANTTGEAWAAQLAWSGNFSVAAEAIGDGRRHLQLGALLAPGELVLGPGESYRTPDLVAAWSPNGLNGISQTFHRHVRSHLTFAGSPRPVIVNTWEAVYFHHDLDTLCRLADAGAAVGAERFVLDDGWFGSRRDDTSGLGDWVVSTDVWPDGLGPLIDHVTGLGMQFGLWVEPEMVNPDSDLYRAHPDWTLTTDGYTPVMGRRQLVLDFGRPEVRDHLFTVLDGLLRDNDIAYFKWDMNRDVVQGSGATGAPGAHAHIVGLYEVLDRLRAAHPTVEIESCSSGGGRADIGILRHTDRIWTSDSNDAVDRQRIQRGFSVLFPPEVMGAHVGPPRSHTTARRHRLGFRLATALFGHLGFEWNLLEVPDDERAVIARGIDHYKRHRSLLHGGDVVRLDHADAAIVAHGVVATDRSEALFAVAKLDSATTTVGHPVRLAGLDPDRRYRIEVIDDLGSCPRAGRTRPAWLDEPVVATGRQLVELGLQPPVMHPESVLLVHLSSADAHPPE